MKRRTSDLLSLEGSLSKCNRLCGLYNLTMKKALPILTRRASVMSLIRPVEFRSAIMGGETSVFFSVFHVFEFPSLRVLFIEDWFLQCFCLKIAIARAKFGTKRRITLWESKYDLYLENSVRSRQASLVVGDAVYRYLRRMT